MDRDGRAEYEPDDQPAFDDPDKRYQGDDHDPREEDGRERRRARHRQLESLEVTFAGQHLARHEDGRGRHAHQERGKQGIGSQVLAACVGENRHQD